MSEITQEGILQALEHVPFGGTGKSVVTLGLVKRVKPARREVRVELELPSPGYPRLPELMNRVNEVLATIPGVESVRVDASWRVRETETHKPALPGVKNVVAVASGKGGVGKSTVASNLAVALAAAGARTGLLDLDIHGPSATVALGESRPPGADGNERMIPRAVHGVSFLSMGQLVKTDQPIVWRGPMLHKMVTTFVNADWGELDYLVLDLPPGTGDVQLTVTQGVPVAGAVIVTTPQEIALIDARKGLTMFRDSKVEILGIVENMSWYDCRNCGKRHALFAADGGAELARAERVPLLARLPVDPAVMDGGDRGRPVALDDSPAGHAFRAMAFEAAAALGERSLRRNPFRVLS